MDIRKITPLELPLLTQLFDYNNPAEMIEQNQRDINNGTIDIFVMFVKDRPIGELHVAYESDDERAVKGKDTASGFCRALLILSSSRDMLNLLSVWRTIMPEQSTYMTALDLMILSPESMRNIRATGMSMDCI